MGWDRGTRGRGYMCIYICIYIYMHTYIYIHTYICFIYIPDSFCCNVGDPGCLPGSERSLEKKMTTHSNSLACRIPWTEEPCGLQSLGLERVMSD